MPRDIPSTTLDAIDAGQYAHAWLVLFSLDEGLFGFWPGVGTLTIDGVDYAGFGSFLDIQQIDMGVDITASPVSVRLRAQPETALTPDVLASVDSYSYKNRPATLTIAYFDKSAGTLVTAIQWWSGKIDTIDHDETVGGDYALVARLEPESLDHARTGYRMRSDADQKLLDPTDRFFELAATVPTEQIP